MTNLDFEDPKAKLRARARAELERRAREKRALQRGVEAPIPQPKPSVPPLQAPSTEAVPPFQAPAAPEVEPAPQEFQKPTPKGDLLAPAVPPPAQAPSQEIKAAPPVASPTAVAPGGGFRPFQSFFGGVSQTLGGDLPVGLQETGVISPEQAFSIRQKAKEYESGLAQDEIDAWKIWESNGKNGNNTWAVSDYLDFMWQHPSAVFNQGFRSLGASGTAQVLTGGAGAALGSPLGPAGIAGGFVAGKFAASGVQEYAHSITDFLAQEGYDLNDQRSYVNAFSNPEVMARAREFAAKRGVTIGMFDALTGMIGVKGGGQMFTNIGESALRSFAKDKAAGTIERGAVKQIADHVANTTIDMAGAGAGEASAQLWTQGKIDIPDLVMEVALEPIAAAPTIIAETAIGRYQQEATQATAEDIAAAAAGQPSGALPPEQFLTQKEAEGQGRTLVGVVEKDGGAAVVRPASPEADPATLEAQFGMRDPNTSRMVAVATNDPDLVMSPEEFTKNKATLTQDSFTFANPDTEVGARAKLGDALKSGQRLDYLAAVNLGARLAPVDASKGALYVGTGEGVSLRPTPTAVHKVQLGNMNETHADLLRLAQDPDVELSYNFTEESQLGDPRFEEVAANSIQIKSPVLQKFKEGTTNWTDFAQQLPEFMAQQGMTPKPATPSSAWQDAVEQGLIHITPNLSLNNLDKMMVQTYKGKPLNTAAEVKDFVDKYKMPEPSKTVVSERQRPEKQSALGRRYVGAIPPALTDVSLDLQSGLPPKVVQAANAISKLLTNMKEKFDLKENLVIIFGDGSPAHIQQLATKYNIPLNDAKRAFDVAGVNGSFWAGDGHTVFIQINTMLASDIRQQLTTATHEMGHFLCYSRFSSLPLREQADIFAAYKRYLASSDMSRQSRANHFIRRRQSVSPMGAMETRQEAMTQLFKEQTKRDYYLSFDEWFAEQVARWGATSRKPMSDMAKFFKRLAMELMKLLKEMRRRFMSESFRAEPEMENWLSAMYTGEAKAEWGSVARGVGEAKSAKANAKYLGADTVPHQAESSHIVKVLSRFGPAPGGMPAGGGPGGPASPPPSATAANTPQAIGAHLDKMGRFSKYFLNFRQVAARNKHNPWVQAFARFLELAQLDANKIMANAEERMRDFRNLRRVKGQMEALSGVLFDLTEMTYLTPQEVQRGIRRWPTQQEFQDIVQRHGLSVEGLQVYRRIRSDFFASIDRMLELRKRDALAIADPLLQLQALQQAQEMANALRASPYFPMTRFGKQAVTVRNSNGEVEAFETFYSKREQEQAYAEALKNYPESSGYEHTMSTLPEEMSQYQGMPQWYLDKLKAMPGMTADQIRWIDQLRFELAPSASFKKHLIRRKGRKGYSRDVATVYASYFFKDARHYARIKYSPQMNEQISALRAQHKEKGDVRTRTGPLADYLQDLYTEFANPTHDWPLLRSIAAVWHLGMSVPTAALNLTQLPMMAYPFLAGKFGERAAWKHLTGVTKDITTFYKRGSYKNMSGEEFQAIDRAINENLITESMAAELAAASQSGRFNLYGNALGNFWNEISSKAMWMFQMTEQMNRRVAFRAAWRMAKEQPNAAWLQDVKKYHFLEYQAMMADGWTPTNALAYLAGKHLVNDTMYDYSKAARPRFTRGKLGNLFTFFSFTQNTLFTLSQNKDMWVRYGLMMTLMAGTMGLIPDDIEDVLNWIGRKRFGEQFNLEREARSFVAEVLGPNRPSWAQDLAMHGIARYGFGIPAIMDMMGVSWWPHFDQSKGVALNRVLPLAVTSILQPGADYEKVVSDTTKNVAGAGFGIAFNILELLKNDELSWGDIKRWESAMPRAVKGVFKAYRLMHEGAERDRYGNEILPFDMSDTEHVAEAIGVAFGFNPTRLSQTYDAIAAKREVENTWQAQKALLLKEAWQESQVYKNSEAFNEVMKRVQKFNESAPDKKFVITRETLKRSFGNRAKRREQIRSGQLGPPAIREQIQELYPEATAVQKVK